MSERDLKRTILENEQEFVDAAQGDDPSSETVEVLLSWARGEEIDPEKARRLVERAEASQ